MSRSRKRDDAGFGRVVEFVADSVDFEPDYYNDDYLGRRVTARMRRRDADSYDAYLRELRSDSEEQAALLDALTVNVTSFFRNVEMWEALRPVLRELTSEHRRVRVWNAPCADGREPYSLSMLAHDDPDINERRLRITATDIDGAALDAAREGVYETTRTTDIGEELSPLSDPEQYVERDGDSFRVRDGIKRPISFERHDLIRDEAKSGFHLVFCRNLLIYIDTEYKRPVYDTVTGALEPGGYFVVGMTESLPRDLRGGFETVDKRRRIYRRREAGEE
ncbi:CheR family methyltransferase [Halobium salinum]|uniref:protein-glutamate O-methyltransferase n=1 Tax=Halobium salinum TaxID=1364940 RepID=A0ABD5P8R3_9EURY|nr:protein-glutamate O-methyltransferase CheR [Halobium salinum]